MVCFPNGKLAFFIVETVLGQRKTAAGASSSDLRPIWLPTVDTLRNLFLVPTVEMLDIFQLMRDVVL